MSHALLINMAQTFNNHFIASNKSDNIQPYFTKTLKLVFGLRRNVKADLYYAISKIISNAVGSDKLSHKFKNIVNLIKKITLIIFITVTSSFSSI